MLDSGLSTRLKLCNENDLEKCSC